MVETEKVYNNHHKISSATTSSDRSHHHPGKPNGEDDNYVSTSATFSSKLEGTEEKPGITRSTSAYYVFSSLPQVVHSVRPRTGYRNNVSSSVLVRAMLEQQEEASAEFKYEGSAKIHNGDDSDTTTKVFNSTNHINNNHYEEDEEESNPDTKGVQLNGLVSPPVAEDGTVTTPTDKSPVPATTSPSPPLSSTSSPVPAPPSTSAPTTTTTTVRIHTTYKNRASKFMNRPNVQNGLGANSLLNPYGAPSSGTSNGAIGTDHSNFGTAGSRYFTSHSSSFSRNNNYHSNYHSTNHSGSSLNDSGNNSIKLAAIPNHHNLPHQSRSVVTTKNSLFGNITTSSSFGGISSGATVSGGLTSPQGTTTGSTTTTIVESRPPFVTTVTRGRFLPSKFDLMVEKSLFTFSSRPKPVGLITKHQCSLSGGLKENEGQNNYQPRGAHDYFNVMWDPHVYRGATTTLSSSLKQPDTDLISRDQERHKRRRAFLAGGGNVISGSNSNSNGGVPPNGISTGRNRYRMTTKVTSRSRTFPPPQGRHQVQVQTEEYLEDLTRDLGSRGPDVDAIVQTDPIEDDDLLNSSYQARSNLPVLKTGVDASTQVLPGELVSFDERVQPIVEAVVGKILEQSLLETMEEEEIGALKAQQNRFLEKRKEEEKELKRLQEQQERISAEKERLKRHLEIQLTRQHLHQQHQLQQIQNGDAILSPSSSPFQTSTLLQEHSSAEERIESDEGRVGAMSTSYLLELLPSVINSLRQEGFITDQIGDGSLSSLVPLWASSSSKFDESSNGEPQDLDPDEDIDSSNPCLEGYQSRMNSPEGSAIPEPDPEEKGSDSASPLEPDDNDDGKNEQQKMETEENEDNGNEEEVGSTNEEEKEGVTEICDEQENEIAEVEEENVDKDDTITVENKEDEAEPKHYSEQDEEVKEGEGDADQGDEEEVVKQEESEEIEKVNEENEDIEQVNEENSNTEQEGTDASDLNEAIANNNDNEENNHSASLSSPSQLPNGAIPNVDS